MFWLAYYYTQNSIAAIFLADATKWCIYNIIYKRYARRRCAMGSAYGRVRRVSIDQLIVVV